MPRKPFRLVGDRIVAERLTRMQGAVPRFMTQAARAEWGIEFAETQVLVPKDTRALMRSGKLTVAGGGGLGVPLTRGGTGVQAVIEYGEGLDYAIRQHEDPYYWHDPPEQYQFVGDPLRAAVPHMGRRIGRRYTQFIGRFFQRGAPR